MRLYAQLRPVPVMAFRLVNGQALGSGEAVELVGRPSHVDSGDEHSVCWPEVRRQQPAITIRSAWEDAGRWVRLVTCDDVDRF